MADGMLRSLLVEGILGGVGSVLVFLPQILILFFFILALEDCGYLPRAAFLLDRLMGGVGLSGRAFIPLLSSFACAIPGIMAARTIQNPRDRLVTIMIAPLMTCSARLPVYALIIAAFIPNREVGGIMSLQGLVLFALYFAGIASAMAVAWVFKRTMGASGEQPLMMELPSYHWPHLHNLALGLWERARIFLTRVGTIILTLMVLLWFLSSFPGAPEGATHPAIYYSIAGMIGRGMAVIFEPIGFGWQICIALVPGMAAREVAVGALGTVYALSQSGEALASSLTPIIAQSWTLATALSLLAWYVFAPQCLSTLSVVKRETGGMRWPLIMAGYMFALAYVGLVHYLPHRAVDGEAEMVQNVIVAVIVVFAALYVARKYLPASWRTKLVYLLARARRQPVEDGAVAQYRVELRQRLRHVQGVRGAGGAGRIVQARHQDRPPLRRRDSRRFPPARG